MQLCSLKINFLAHWKSISTKLEMKTMGQGMGTGTKGRWPGLKFWHSTCQHRWPALQPAPAPAWLAQMGFGQGVKDNYKRR